MSIAVKSFHALSPSRQLLWRACRSFVPPRLRFFFEGSMEVRGQLWYEERKLLYETVRRRRPDTVFEVGTWEGGGSTFFIAQALYDAGVGVLHTVEADASLHHKAVEGYAKHLPHLGSFVRFHLGTATAVYPKLLSQLEAVDTVFLDGAQDPNQALNEFEMFDPYLKKDSVLMMHDWENEKMSVVRKRIESGSEWKVLETLTWPHSVGFVVTNRT